jgi:flagellar motor switch protein FliM
VSDILSNDAIAELFERAQDGSLDQPRQPAGRPRRMREIDFSRPTKFTPEQARRIQRLHEDFSRRTSTALSAELRTPIEVEVINTAQLTWSTAVTELPVTSLFAVLEVGDNQERMLLSIELPFVFRCVNLLLGGDPEAGLRESLNRSLTDVEFNLARRLTQRLVDQLALVWRDVAQMVVRLQHIDTEVANVEIVASSEAVLALTIEVGFGHGHSSSTISLVIPHKTVEPVLGLFGVTTYAADDDANGALHAQMREALMDVDLECRGEVGFATMQIEDVLTLTEGAVVDLGPSVDGVRLFAGPSLTHVCKPGRVGEFRGIQIVARAPRP